MAKSEKSKGKKAQSFLWRSRFLKHWHSDEVDLLRYLKRYPFFADLTNRQLGEVARVLHKRTFAENEYLFELGQPGAALFLIERGKVSVEIQGGEETTRLALLHDEDFLGELALLDQSPRSASAVALVPTKAYALFRTELQKLIELHPDIASHIYKSLAEIVGERLLATNQLLQNREDEDFSDGPQRERKTA